MGYYVRVFCTASDVPPLRDVFAWIERNGSSLRLAVDAAPIDLDSPEWSGAALEYKEGKGPILSEVSRDTGNPDCLLREEIEEFKEFLKDADDGPAKQAVLRHLTKTRYIVANQYLGDIDDDGYEASGRMLDYFVRHYGGMVQCDGEGFYEGSDLIVECC
jgi:hypothetical protein